MNYISTRGGGCVSSAQAIIRGIADDGGLYVPEEIPKLDIDHNELAGLDYKSLAYRVLRLYFDFEDAELKSCVDQAYDDKFDTELIAPLVQMGRFGFLELFHGKTLAFKDMALSILPHLMTGSAKKMGLDKEIVILTATSGDTGKAALEGFKDIEGIKIVVFFPEDGTSVLQKCQMQTQEGANTYVIGVRGNFDDTQSRVKEIFADPRLRELADTRGNTFSSANSINIGRLIPQIIYYYYAYAQLLRSGMTPGEKISFAVPTGNFGDILAGYYAKRMGLPINKLICASNDNNVLYDFFMTGEFNINRKFIQTISPSMDILLPSNFERLVYDVLKSSGELTKLMRQLRDTGKYNIDTMLRFDDFFAYFTTEEEAREAIKKVYRNHNYIIDPHTAVAYAAYEKYGGCERTVILSTASPYKFTKTVMNAIDPKYSCYDDFELIDHMAKLQNRPAPEQILGINKKTVLHSKTVEKDEMKDETAKILMGKE